MVRTFAWPDGSGLGAGATSLPAEIEAELREFANAEDLDYEHKPHGGALHYRRNPGAGDRAHAFAEQLATRHGWAAQGGKFVVELVAGNANKGSAVKALMSTQEFVGACPIFVGDDLTDEAGFLACQEMGGTGILVGDRQGSCADHQIANVSLVHQWLEL